MNTQLPSWLAKLHEATPNRTPLYWVTDMSSEAENPSDQYIVSQIAIMSPTKRAEHYICSQCGAISQVTGQHFFSYIPLHDPRNYYPEALCMECMGGVLSPRASFPSYITDWDPAEHPVWNTDYHFRVNLNADLATHDKARTMAWQILADMEEELNYRVAEALEAERQQAQEDAEQDTITEG